MQRPKRVRFETELAELGLLDDDDDDGPRKKKRWNLPPRREIVGWYSLIAACQQASRLRWVEIMREFYRSESGGERIVASDTEYGVVTFSNWLDHVQRIASQLQQ